jgi:hypothetical protein
VPIFKEDWRTIEQILFIVEDTTKRKALENKLEQNTKELEEKIEEHTSELRARVEELEQFERVTVGREMRMSDLVYTVGHSNFNVVILEITVGLAGNFNRFINSDFQGFFQTVRHAGVVKRSLFGNPDLTKQVSNPRVRRRARKSGYSQPHENF